jgi:hypothetical protein
MRVQKHAEFEVIERPQSDGGLDLVVPFTTPALTQAALDAANQMGTGLNASIRLVKVQVVPFPMDLNQSPVALDFVREQMRHFRSELETQPEIRLAREHTPGLVGTLRPNSVVVIAYRKRPWRTREERLAGALWKAGYHAVLTGESNA